MLIAWRVKLMGLVTYHSFVDTLYGDDGDDPLSGADGDDVPPPRRPVGRDACDAVLSRRRAFPRWLLTRSPSGGPPR